MLDCGGSAVLCRNFLCRTLCRIFRDRFLVWNKEPYAFSSALCCQLCCLVGDRPSLSVPMRSSAQTHNPHPLPPSVSQHPSIMACVPACRAIQRRKRWPVTTRDRPPRLSRQAGWRCCSTAIPPGRRRCANTSAASRTPHAANYHKWLTPQQYGAQFGVAPQDIQAVETWLQSQGFQIASVPASANFIQFSGTVGQIEQAFHTSIHSYSINGGQACRRRDRAEHSRGARARNRRHLSAE